MFLLYIYIFSLIAVPKFFLFLSPCIFLLSKVAPLCANTSDAAYATQHKNTRTLRHHLRSIIKKGTIIIIVITLSSYKVLFLFGFLFALKQRLYNNGRDKISPHLLLFYTYDFVLISLFKKKQFFDILMTLYSVESVASCYVYWRYTGMNEAQDTFSIRPGG